MNRSIHARELEPKTTLNKAQIDCHGAWGIRRAEEVSFCGRIKDWSGRVAAAFKG